MFTPDISKNKVAFGGLASNQSFLIALIGWIKTGLSKRLQYSFYVNANIMPRQAVYLSWMIQYVSLQF